MPRSEERSKIEVRSSRGRRWLIALAFTCGLGSSAAAWIRLGLPPTLSGERELDRFEPASEASVRIYLAEVPYSAGLATHAWFVTRSPGLGDAHRWELWQSPVGPHGHVGLDLNDPETPVGGGPTRLLHEYRGAEAERLIEVLEQRAPTYPCRDRYRLWPGPNSNGFVRWVLDEAELPLRLPPSSFGARWSCR